MIKTILAIAAAAALVAACDRESPPTPASGTTSSSGPSQAQSNTPSTPANIPGKATPTDKTVPAQGQVDARQEPQQRDFEKKGN